MQPVLRLLLAALAATAPAACAVAPEAPATVAPAGTILQRSTPAAGATVTGPVNQLILEFSRPALLNEVIVTGPDGTMPMMLSPAGEQPRYAIPLPGLGPGAYSVGWRARVGTEEYRGDFAFTVR